MDSARFVIPDDRAQEDILDTTCAICHKIAINPKTCMRDHLFCHTCIHTHLQTSSICPGDTSHKHPLTRVNIFPSRIAQRLISRLTIRCENNGAAVKAYVGGVRKRTRQKVGCKWSGRVSELEGHVEQCGFRFVRCEKCDTEILALGLDAHSRNCGKGVVVCDMCDENVSAEEMAVHNDVCTGVGVLCPNHCLVQPGKRTDVTLLRRGDVKKHLESCPKQIVTCVYGDVGCTFRAFRENLQTHMEEQLESHMELVLEAVKEVRRVSGRVLELERKFEMHFQRLNDLENALREKA